MYIIYTNFFETKYIFPLRLIFSVAQDSQHDCQGHFCIATSAWYGSWTDISENKQASFPINILMTSSKLKLYIQVLLQLMYRETSMATHVKWKWDRSEWSMKRALTNKEYVHRHRRSVRHRFAWIKNPSSKTNTFYKSTGRLREYSPYSNQEHSCL